MTIARIVIRRENGGLVFLGVPLFAVWLLLLPAGLVLAPLVLIACLVARIDPLQALSHCRRIFSALKGTRLRFEDGRRLVVVHIP